MGGTVSNAAQIGGVLYGAYAVMQFFLCTYYRCLSDQFGRRPVLLASLFGFGIDYLFLAFAPTIGWLFVGRLIAGVMGASFSSANAYIADISTPENRAQNFGLMGAASDLDSLSDHLWVAFWEVMVRAIRLLQPRCWHCSTGSMAIHFAGVSETREQENVYLETSQSAGYFKKPVPIPCRKRTIHSTRIYLHRFACRANELGLLYEGKV